ncbi:HAMP domain-containing histidine kinase [Microcoleus sp. FACHB-831]|uniref:HAMP domain-containing sensor histidine kinase n=1 Tax=Microcoleus sp. FACHB-831 TaxID=2692827 RepID=UPI0016855C8C|nr:ATP-binding protein [Microcoleus sp. FACHB-831]MBD1923296.1 HAMP domain-containing histidine kinase [Microcoleus sp. FACHB-831]
MGLLPIPIRLNSIYRKLLVTYLALTALGTSLMASYILWSFYGYFMRTRQAELTTWTNALAESVADALEEKDLKRVEVIVKRYGAPEAITLRVFAPDGRLLSTSAPNLDRQVTDWLAVAGMKEALQNNSAKGMAKGILSNDDRLYAAQPIVRNGQMLGVVRMSITLEQFQRQFRIVIFTVLGTLILTLVLCALISEQLARNIARPIQAMCNFAIQLGGGHLGEKLNIRKSDDELGQLAIELNRMSERLASLDKERRAFLASVSHELRTPVSNVLVTLEALESGADEEPELRGRFMKTAQDETKRLSGLIKDLLDLGRLEAGVTSLEQQPVKLRDLIDRAVRAMELRMRASGISIRVEVADLQLQGDPERLIQAFLNILDNAIKHSMPDSQVFISGKVEGTQIAVQIIDRGTGISEGDLPRIFEQFYTADPSRKGSGTGLGLAIARRIVEAHRGTITASSSVGKGATFTIRLPLNPSPEKRSN